MQESIEFLFDKQGVELQCFSMKGMGDLRRNDVFVFNKPVINHHITFVINYVYCKRCIGLPGDSVSIRNGYYRNIMIGVSWAAERIKLFCVRCQIH